MSHFPGQTTYRHAIQPPLRSRALESASLVLAGAFGVRAVALREGQPLVVGRSSPAQVTLDDKSLSRSHARFELREGRVHVEDLGSTNGSFRDDERIERAVLDDGDRIHLGQVEVWVSAASVAAPDPEHDLEAWTARLDHELERARLFGRPISVLALRDSKGPDPDAWTALGEQLRVVDALSLYAPRIALVLLPELDPTAAERWLHAASEVVEPGRFSAALASFPQSDSSAEALVEKVIAALRSARGTAVAHVDAIPQTESKPHAQGAPIVASPCMRELYALVARVARTPLPVLVFGETGSGKEHIARAVHDESPRRDAPFVALNCATIPKNLIESVLFGHEKGAFTGAEKRATGVFERASGGTVFLDEIGELSPDAQAALLRVLETKRIQRVGATDEIEVDVRVVAATHRDLGRMVRDGDFREDLMYRLDALSLHVPPLRERPEEIAPLAQAFLEGARAQWAAGVTAIGPEALARLESYGWPGNVRQLKNAVERACAVCGGSEIGVGDLPGGVVAGEGVVVAEDGQWMAGVGLPPRAPTAAPQGAAGIAPFAELDGFSERVRAYEVELIRAALTKTGGNQSKAAVLLGMPRRTLANKVHLYRLI